MKYRIIKGVRIILCYLLLIVAMTMLIFSTRNYKTISDKIIDFKDQNTQSVYLRVSDVYDHDGQKSLHDFFSEESALDRMKKFCEILNEKYEFLEFDTQPLMLREPFRYKDQLRKDYGSEYFGENDHIGISLKSIQMGKNSTRHFDLQSHMMLGRCFEQNDYIFDGQKPIPVILGYEYSDFHHVGDTIKVEFLSEDVTLSVIGFTAKNTWITLNNHSYFLDESIILPFIDVNTISQDKDDLYFQKILYSLKAWGYIEVKDGDSYYTYKNQIDEISQSLELRYVVNEGAVSNHITNISNSLFSAKGILFIFSIVIFILLGFAVLFIYLYHYHQNKKEYAIRLISGCSLNTLKYKIYAEIILSFIVSLVIAAIINRIILGYDAVYRYAAAKLSQAVEQAVWFSLITILLILSAIRRNINNESICFALQKE